MTRREDAPQEGGQREKRNTVVVTKLRRSERTLLRQVSRRRRKAGLPDWTCSSILRRALLHWLEEGQP
jgi:hypothetical protein